MRWCSFIGLTRITNKLIRTMVVIILSLSNLESGLSSRVAKEHFEDLRDIILKNRELFLSSENERLKAPISSKMQKATSVLNRLEKRQPINFEQTESVQAIRDVSDTKYNQPVYSNSSTFQKNTLWRPNEKDNKHQMLNEAGENHIPINLSLEKNNSASTPSSVATHFGTENSTVITTQIGATALIPCIVHQIGEGVISWIRKKDYHLLTVGLTTYSSDERFSANHLKHSEDWTLQIKYVQQRDAGIYECQISTHPPTSIFLHLDVVEARAEITGPSIRYLTPGSTLRLHCLIVQNTETSEYIFWYHDNRMINYDSDRGVNVSTDPDFQSSELVISATRREHSGNYTCVASNTQPASVLVHIFKGDNPAAMYHGHVGSSTKSYHAHLVHIAVAVSYRVYARRKFMI